MGNAPEKIINNAGEYKVKCVCDSCNRGWMSDLEQKVKSTVGCMVQDLSISLDAAQQQDIIAWATKIAMVGDATKASSAHGLFYSREDCHQLRIASKLPAHNYVLLGRFTGSGLDFEGSIFKAEIGGKVASNVCTTTIVVGHLAAQVITSYHTPEYEDQDVPLTPKQGTPWDRLLVGIGGSSSSTKVWPPELSFTNDRGALTIGRLQDRWRMGESVPI
jgi:hypothetical protein